MPEGNAEGAESSCPPNLNTGSPYSALIEMKVALYLCLRIHQLLQSQCRSRHVTAWPSTRPVQSMSSINIQLVSLSTTEPLLELPRWILSGIEFHVTAGSITVHPGGTASFHFGPPREASPLSENRVGARSERSGRFHKRLTEKTKDKIPHHAAS